MTVSESIITWLKDFENQSIDTDILKVTVNRYALVKEPNQQIKAYITGKKEYTDHYTFQACLASQTNTDRIDNQEYGERLSEWVEEKNINQEFPLLADAKVTYIGITTPFYMGQTATNESVYEMTIAIKYIKER
ncbi:MAG: hypothetical protein U0L56_00365 [Lachnospiraceae bacterium]|nr:hypothetical protein [Lachnospiraceae bacterium]